MVTCEAGLAYLRSTGIADAPLYVNVVVGSARKGKSFFLNNLANVTRQTDGFSVGHTASAHTKGFWINRAASNETVTTPAGDTVLPLYMDTEGFGAIGNFESHDPKLCAIAAIFASNLFFNVRGEISMGNIKFLSSMSHFDEYFLRKHNWTFPSPPLTWVVQNWEYPVDQYDPPNALGYLKFVLAQKSQETIRNDDSDSRKVRAYNDLFRKLNAKFSAPSQRNVPPIVLLDHPSRATPRTELTSLTFDEYDDGYKRQLRDLRSRVQQDAASKQFVGGRSLTGEKFAKTLHLLVQAMNQMAEVGDALVKAHAKDVADAALQQFLDAATNLSTPSVSQQLYAQSLKKAKVAILGYFDRECLGSSTEPINAELRGLLVERVEDKGRLFAEKNVRNQYDRCQEAYAASLAGLEAQCSGGRDVVQYRECTNEQHKGFRRLCGPGWCEKDDEEDCRSHLNGTVQQHRQALEKLLEQRMSAASMTGFFEAMVGLFVASLLSKMFCPTGSPWSSRLYDMGCLMLAIAALQIKICQDYVCSHFEGRALECLDFIGSLPQRVGRVSFEVKAWGVVASRSFDRFRNTTVVYVERTIGRDDIGFQIELALYLVAILFAMIAVRALRCIICTGARCCKKSTATKDGKNRPSKSSHNPVKPKPPESKKNN